MRRRPKLAKAQGESKPPVVRKSRRDEAATIRDLEKRFAEALEQQTATAEILRVISSSPTDLQPVLEAVAESAARLCGADDVNIHLVDGELLRLTAKRGSIPTVETRPIVRTRHIGRAVLERRTIHLHDMRAALAEFPDAAPLAEVRTALATPLLRKGVAIGVIQIRRLVLRPFSAKQVALLETFANQHRHRECPVGRGAAGTQPRSDRSPGATHGDGRDPESD
jgi:putative methionine-R-sulfoxide reductase with GAF domain